MKKISMLYKWILCISFFVVAAAAVAGQMGGQMSPGPILDGSITDAKLASHPSYTPVPGRILKTSPTSTTIAPGWLPATTLSNANIAGYLISDVPLDLSGLAGLQGDNYGDMFSYSSGGYTIMENEKLATDQADYAYMDNGPAFEYAFYNGKLDIVSYLVGTAGDYTNSFTSTQYVYPYPSITAKPDSLVATSATSTTIDRTWLPQPEIISDVSGSSTLTAAGIYINSGLKNLKVGDTVSLTFSLACAKGAADGIVQMFLAAGTTEGVDFGGVIPNYTQQDNYRAAATTDVIITRQFMGTVTWDGVNAAYIDFVMGLNSYGSNCTSASYRMVIRNFH